MSSSVGQMQEEFEAKPVDFVWQIQLILDYPD